MTQHKKRMLAVIAFCISFLLANLGLSHAQTKKSSGAVEGNEMLEREVSEKGQNDTTSSKKKKKNKKKGKSKKKKGTKKKKSKKRKTSSKKQGEEETAEEATGK